MMLNTTRKQQLQAKMRDEGAFATSLLAICLDTYGTDIFTWDPRTLWINIAEDFGVELLPLSKDKIQALILVYTTDLPLVSVEAFNHVCNVLSGSEANFRSWDRLDVHEALWGIYEMLLHIGINREEGEDPPEFGHEVRRYLGVILQEDGIFDPPDILKIAEMDDALGPEIWADDPQLFNAAYDLQKTNQRELLNFLAQRLGQMMQEINNLPLQHKDAETWQKFRAATEQSIPQLLSEQSAATSARM